MYYKKMRSLAFLLVFALILCLGNGYYTRAESSQNDIQAWFSNVESGGLYPYACTNQTVYVNYRYVGEFSSYRTSISVKDEDGNSVFFESYSNMERFQTSITLTKAGDYTAVISVTSGSEKATKTISLSVFDELPSIQEQPSDVTTTLYQSATFQIKLNNPADASYQWFKSSSLDSSGTELSGSTSNVLSITGENVVPALNGTYYYCQITQAGKTICSNYARLVIEGQTLPSEAPKATEAPKETASPVNTAEPSQEPAQTTAPKPSATETLSANVPGSSQMPSAKPSTGTTAPASTKPNASETSSPQSTPTTSTVISPTIRYDSMTIKASYNAPKNCISISWSLNGDSGISQISVLRSSRKNGSYQTLGTPTGSSFVDRTIRPGKTYYYKVSYLKNEENIYTYYFSNIVTITASPKPSIKKISARKKRRKMIVSWSYGRRASRVIVYVKTGKKWQKVGTKPGTDTSCRLSVPTGYQTVRVRIRPYTVIQKKKYYGKFSKTVKVKF